MSLKKRERRRSGVHVVKIYERFNDTTPFSGFNWRKGMVSATSWMALLRPLKGMSCWSLGESWLSRRWSIILSSALVVKQKWSVAFQEEEWLQGVFADAVREKGTWKSLSYIQCCWTTSLALEFAQGFGWRSKRKELLRWREQFRLRICQNDCGDLEKLPFLSYP